MPRISIIPDDWEESEEKANGDGSPTIDVCRRCAKAFEEGGDIPTDIINDLSENGFNFTVDDMVGSTDVEHPPFAEQEYDCDICNRLLTKADD